MSARSNATAADVIHASTAPTADLPPIQLVYPAEASSSATWFRIGARGACTRSPSDGTAIAARQSRPEMGGGSQALFALDTDRQTYRVSVAVLAGR